MALQIPTTSIPSATKAKTPVPRWITIAALVCLAIVAVFAVLLTVRWPFTPEGVTKALQEQSQSRVQIARFRRLYFPHPGAVAEGVKFHRDLNAGAPPLMTIERITIQTSYLGLLTHHIRQITAERLHLRIPPATEDGAAPVGAAHASHGTTSSGLVIDHLIADGAQVEIAATPNRPEPLIFTVRKLALNRVTDHRPLSFDATVENPEPPGEVHVKGEFGPWKFGDGDHTPLSGSYTFDRADLGVFHGISGVLSARGKFDGVLDHVNTEGTVTVPDFETTHAGHPMTLTTHFHALVNGTNGDVSLNPLKARLGNTSITGYGEIEGEANHKGKTVSLQLASQHGRVQDLLRLFLEDARPPMVGPIIFRAGVVLPPEESPFLKRVRLDGDFGISGAQYTNAKTQRDVDIASAKAQGKAEKIEDDQDKDKKDGTDKTEQDLEHVVSNVKGHVSLRNGIATLTRVSFDVPGASAQVSGTYSLLNHEIDLHGVVQIDAKLSQATTGVKSFLLKIVQPMTRKKKNTGTGSVVSLKITGTYRNPSFLVTPMAGKKE